MSRRVLQLINKGITSLEKVGVKETWSLVKKWARYRNGSYYSDVHIEYMYNRWMAIFGTIRQSDIEEMKTQVKEFKYQPKISVVVPVYNPNEEYLRIMLDSIIRQTYENWELCIADDKSTNPNIRSILEEYKKKDSRIKVVYRERNGNISAASNTALELATGEYTALVDHDDIVPVEALWIMVYYINHFDNQVDLLYSDEDKLDEQGKRYNPYFKGGWNRQLIYQENFVAHLGVYRTSILKEIDGFRVGYEGSQDYDILLRFLKKTSDERIVHVPYVLYHWRKNANHSSFSTEFQDKSDLSAKKALEEYFEGKREVVPCNGLVGCWQIKKAEYEYPLVSIIIPFRDKVHLLKQCVEGILNKTDYKNLEVILVDNGSVELNTKKYLDNIKTDARVHVYRDDREFNYSRLNNEAAKEAQGELLLFLNNDIAMIDERWLRELVNAIEYENVGAAGGKLLYGNYNIQHAGVTTGIYEVAGHPFRHISNKNVGYFGWPVLERDTSAVTGACLLIKKEIFDEVGGFDEQNLAVSFNDVDLCLKIRNRGYRIIYTPYSLLLHLESQSRGDDITKKQKDTNYAERRFMHKKYGISLREDPFYSPHLSLDNEDVTIADYSRVGKPWRDWIEFVCPFHRGDVLIGLQVACTAAVHGKRIRMHVSKDVYEWLKAFPYERYIEIEPIDVPIPKAADTEYYNQQAKEKVALREDSSGYIVSAHPKRDLDKMGIDNVEFMLEQLGLPIDTKLINLLPVDIDEVDRAQYLTIELDKTVLIHPYGGWSLKSMSDSIVKEVAGIVHASGYRLIQIGGASDEKITCADGYLLENMSLSEWKYVFQNAKAVIGVDSWTSHFGAIVNANQVIIFGSTSSRDVESKRHFEEQGGQYIKFESDCDETPCHSLQCKFGDSHCIGMGIDKKRLLDYLNELQ